MAIDSQGWFDWCERVPGPADKTYSEANAVTMFIPHSAVGYYGGWSSRLFSTARDAQGRYTPYAAASVHLWFPQLKEKPKQHYSIYKSCWASGHRYPNTHGVAAENEGGYTPKYEPLTDWQVECNTRAIKELSALKGWKPKRPTSETDLTATLYEHRECVRWGADPTSCPSNRIPWTRLIAALEDDMALSAADKAEIENMIQAGVLSRIRHDYPTFRDEVNHLIRAANIPRDEAAATLRALVDEHNNDAAKHAGGGGGKVTFPGATVSIPPVTVNVEEA